MPTLISTVPPKAMSVLVGVERSNGATRWQRIRAVFAQGVPGQVTGELAERGPLLIGGRPDHQPGPRPDVDPVVDGQLTLDPDRDRVLGQRAAGRPDEGAVGRIQVL